MLVSTSFGDPKSRYVRLCSGERPGWVFHGG